MFDNMYQDNNYKRLESPKQETYIDVDYQMTPPRRNNSGTRVRWKTLLAGFLAGAIFTVSISFASITAYAHMINPNKSPLSLFNFDSQSADQEVQAASQPNGAMANQQITTAALSSNGKLTIPEIVVKAKDSVVGISAAVNSFRSIGTSTGTGIIYSTDGTIITNAHVINGSSAIKVTLNDGTTYDAKLIGMDVKSDLAVIKISASGLKKASFGDSNTLVVGETAVAIGNPLGLEFSGTVTAGIISALNREINVDGRYMTLIQTDAAINPGNSGGPLLNQQGYVVGINSVKVSSTDTEGLGFAIPISDALPIIEQLISKGHIAGRPSIGVSGEDISAQTASYYKVPQGFLVRSVSIGSGAELGGLKAGDIITGFNGVTITNQAELNREKDRCKAGDKAKITVYRVTTGETITLTIVLSESVA
jgi:serine protease Do